MKTRHASDGSIITFPAIRGNQGKKEFYCIMCSFATVHRRFNFVDDPRIEAEHKAQRKIRSTRVPTIANYIIDNPDNYVFSSVTISVAGRLEFHPAVGEGSDAKVGSLAIPVDAPILVNDGQHRCAAIRHAYETNPNLANEKISVVVFEDKGLKRSQQMFADLNKHAVKPTKSLGLLYDHRDTYARFIVNMVKDVEIFRNRTEMEKTTISNRSTKFFTLNGIADATKYLLKLKTKSVSAEKQKLAVDYWNKVAQSIPQWNLLMQKKMSPFELRQGYVHAHTNVLNALGLVGHVLVQHPDWPRKIKKFQKVDWRKSSPVWQNNIVVEGKMVKNRFAIKMAANEILSTLGIRETVEGVHQ